MERVYSRNTNFLRYKQCQKSGESAKFLYRSMIMRASRRANNSRRIVLKYPGLYIAVKSPVSTPTDVVIPPEGEQSRFRLPTPPPQQKTYTKQYIVASTYLGPFHICSSTLSLRLAQSLDVFKVSN